MLDLSKVAHQSICYRFINVSFTNTVTSYVASSLSRNAHQTFHLLLQLQLVWPLLSAVIHNSKTFTE